MSDGRLNAEVDQYLQAAAANVPPPPITSDPLVAGVTPVEQVLRILGLAANLGDEQDSADSARQHAERDAKMRDAAEKFALQDEQAAAEFASTLSDQYPPGDGAAGEADQAAAMAQQLPQTASGIASTVAGTLGGLLQSLAQLPQQAAQGMQQGLQTGAGLFQQAAAAAAAPIEDAALADIPLPDDFGSGDGALEGLGAFGGGADGAGLSGSDGPFGAAGGTAPTAYLGPPPVPSAGTAPSSAPITSIAAPAHPPTAPTVAPGMAGMPMIPPGAMAGTAGGDKNEKTDTKKLSVPQIRNGAPVQGRLSVPPVTPPVTGRTEATPTVTRRVVASGRPDDAKPDC